MLAPMSNASLWTVVNMANISTTEIGRTIGSESKSERVTRLVRERILDGTYPLDSRLPPAQQLSRDMSVSQVTILRGLKQLADEGYITSYPDRRGTVVINNARIAPPRATTIACLLRPHLAKRPDDNFGLEMIQGLREGISQGGYRFIYHGLDEEDYAGRMLELARSGDTPGIVLDQKTPASIAAELAGTGVPAVMFNRRLDVRNLSCVFPNYEDAARQSVHMLLDRGYECLGYSSIQNDQASWSESDQAGEAAIALIWQGFQSAIMARRIPLESIHLIAEPTLHEVTPATPEFFGLPRKKPADWRPLGVLANFGRRALGLLEAIRQTDLVLGRDIGVITLIDLQICREAPQPPSVWHVDRNAVGASAAHELIARIEDPAMPASMTKIPMTFVDRGTF
jgi:DNA-binding LacI/PurR family transcriptional regulator